MRPSMFSFTSRPLERQGLVKWLSPPQRDDHSLVTSELLSVVGRKLGYVLLKFTFSSSNMRDN